MTTIPFYIVDVFAEQKFAGNQLAVFVGNPPTEIMQQIALEMNYSETTFISANEPENGGYNVRIFTPSTEYPFAGHPTIGTATVIHEKFLQGQTEQVNLNLKVGQIPVTFKSDGVAWMRQNPPEFGQTYAVDDIAELLNLSPQDIDDRFPIQEVTTGLPFIIIPLKTLDAVRRARTSPEKINALLAQQPTQFGANAVLIFAPETYHTENDLNARVLVDGDGMAEDPATGSANGCLASYLVKYRYLDTASISVQVEQGYEIRRPSLLYLEARKHDNIIEVNVGGKVFFVAEGQLNYDG